MENSFLYVGSFLLAVSLFTSCTGDRDWSGGLKNSDLVLQTYLPTEDTRGTELSIRGSNFGENISQVQVWANEKEAEVVSVTSTRTIAGVAEASGSDVVKVRVGEVVYSHPDLLSYGYIRNVYTVAGNDQGTTVNGAYLQVPVQWPIVMVYDRWDDTILFLQDEGEHRIHRMKDDKIETLYSTRSLVNNAHSICFSLGRDTLFIGNDNTNNYVVNPVTVGMVTRRGGFEDLKLYIPSEKLAQPHINGIAVNLVDGSLFTYRWGRHVFRHDKAAGTCKYVITRDQFSELVVGLFPDANGNMRNTDDGGGHGGLAFPPDGKTLYWDGRDPCQGILKADYDLITKKCTSLTRFASNGVWGIIDGQGISSRMNQPNQIAVGTEGNLLVTTVYGRTIRKITPEGYVNTYAGVDYQTGYIDGLATEARFSKPYGIVIDAQDSVYVGDCKNWHVWVIKEEWLLELITGIEN